MTLLTMSFRHPSAMVSGFLILGLEIRRSCAKGSGFGPRVWCPAGLEAQFRVGLCCSGL